MTHDTQREGEGNVIDRAFVLNHLSSEEKIALLSGDDIWHTVAVPRLGVPRVRVSYLTIRVQLWLTREKPVQ